MMKLPLLATPLLAALLLSTSSCAKKDDPAASPATGTGSYTLDGRAVTSKATAVVNTTRTTTGQTYDVLDVQLVTTPQPASGPETVDLVFQKPTGQPSAAYQLNTISLLNAGRTQSISYANDATTLTTTSGGGFSGTFSATATGSAIRSGVFTDVRP
ncbi:MAG: hypothetical protein EOO63_01435 [Hymenobacter sp.]|nr:MAG: hypothetical protein EOO63_01435 [Hymenobacter sp.]